MPTWQNTQQKNYHGGVSSKWSKAPPNSQINMEGTMKRFGNIYSKIYSYDNLEKAYKNARKNKTFYREVKEVDASPDEYLIQLQNMLIWKTYKTSEYEIFDLKDGEKVREIYKLPFFPDRICQWAIMLQIEKMFIDTFPFFTCASIPNRGIHYASDLTNKYINGDNAKYCLKVDVKKFFPNIDHEISRYKLRRRFKDPDLLWLLDDIIYSIEGGKGIPIGNYTSQYLANFYLKDFDNWIYNDKGFKQVVRYMDDIVVFDNDKNKLHKLRSDMEEYLNKELKLDLKGNYQVFPTKVRGVDFVGYRHFGDYTLLRKSTAKALKNKCKRIYKYTSKGIPISYSDFCSINSYKGWIKWADGYNLYKEYIYPIEENIRREEGNNEDIKRSTIRRES